MGPGEVCSDDPSRTTATLPPHALALPATAYSKLPATK